jgi:hypothetical protein
MPTSGLAAGNWIWVKQEANNTLTFASATIDGDSGYALTTQYQSVLLIYSGSGSAWDAN